MSTPGDVAADSVWALAIATLLGVATAIHHGRWDLAAFAVLAVAFALAGVRFVAQLRGPSRPVPPRRAAAIVLALLGVGALVAALDRTLLPEAAMARWTVGKIARGLSWALLLSYLPFTPLGSRAPEPDRIRSARFIAFAVLTGIAGLAVISASPEPDIDVWTIQQRGAEILAQGKNPYVWATVPDTDPETDFVVPYVYPPLPIVLGVAGRLAGGDVRYGLLAAILVSGIALRRLTRQTPRLPAILEDAPALAFWLWPPLFMILDRAWIDPLQVVLIALGALAAVRGRLTLAAIVLGLAASSKQSMFWLVPPAIVLLRFDLRRVVVLGVAAALPLVPFAIADFRRLEFCLLGFMASLPPRSDGLCFTSFVTHVFGVSFPTQTGFVLAAAVVLVACLRPRSGARGFGWALHAAFFAFFFFNRWAFANYFFLLGGLAILASALASTRSERAPSGPLTTAASPATSPAPAESPPAARSRSASPSP